MLGGWIVEPSGTQPSFVSFIPSALFSRGVATNVTLWQMARVRLVRKRFWPELIDKSMAEILTDRFAREFQANQRCPASCREERGASSDAGARASAHGSSSTCTTLCSSSLPSSTARR